MESNFGQNNNIYHLFFFIFNHNIILKPITKVLNYFFFSSASSTSLSRVLPCPPLHLNSSWPAILGRSAKPIQSLYVEKIPKSSSKAKTSRSPSPPPPLFPKKKRKNPVHYSGWWRGSLVFHSCFIHSLPGMFAHTVCQRASAL